MTMSEANAVTPDRLRELLADEAAPLAHRTLWRLLWEGEMRLNDLLALDVRDVDLGAQTARVDFPKADRVPYMALLSEASAGMLRLVVGGREDGPLFVTESGRPVSREVAGRVARGFGVAIHGFRLGGQRARAVR